MVRTANRAVRQSAAYERRRLRICAEEAAGAILDLGHAQLPNPYLPGSRTVGVDINPTIAHTGYSENIVGSVFDLETLLGGRMFDTIIAGELIEHLERPYDFLRTLKSLLTPDGRLVLSTPNPLGFPVLGMEILRSQRWFYTREHTFYFLPRWVERMLDLSGFKLEKTRRVGLWLPFGYLPWCPLWCSYQLVYVARISQ